MDNLSYRNAIGQIESSNNYGSIGPATRNGDRAYGRYQVMGNNVGDWTEKWFGQRLTPQQFLGNQQAQDAVFDGQFGSAVQKYGNPQDAASVWFSGRPLAQAGNANDQYISTPEYVRRFNAALGQPDTTQAQQPQTPYNPAPAQADLRAALGEQPQQAAPQAQTPFFPIAAQAAFQPPSSLFQPPQAPQIYYAPRQQVDLSQLRASLYGAPSFPRG